MIADGSHANRSTRVVVADHHPDYLDLLVLLVDAMPTLDVVGKTLNGAEAVRLALELCADLGLLEVLMPSLEALTPRRKSARHVRRPWCSSIRASSGAESASVRASSASSCSRSWSW